MAIKFERIADSLICGDWQQNGHDEVGSVPMDTKRLCILIDIARSLRAIRRHVECPNVREGFISMREAAVTLKRRLPVPKKKAKRKAVK